jgi:hypothetical protein
MIRSYLAACAAVGPGAQANIAVPAAAAARNSRRLNVVSALN